MGYQVGTLVPEHSIVEARFFGNVTTTDVTGAFTECILMAMQLDTWNVLADCTELVWTPTITDLKDLVDALSDLGVTDRFREALVRPTDVTAAVSVGFWETAGVNRGLDIQGFRARADAIDWLEAGRPSGTD